MLCVRRVRGAGRAVLRRREYTVAVLGAECSLGGVLCEQFLSQGHDVRAVVSHIDNARRLDRLMHLQKRGSVNSPELTDQENCGSSLEIFEVHPLHPMAYDTPLFTCDYVVGAKMFIDIVLSDDYNHLTSSKELSAMNSRLMKNMFDSVKSSHTINRLILCHCPEDSEAQNPNFFSSLFSLYQEITNCRDSPFSRSVTGNLVAKTGNSKPLVSTLDKSAIDLFHKWNDSVDMEEVFNSEEVQSSSAVHVDISSICLHLLSHSKQNLL